MIATPMFQNHNSKFIVRKIITSHYIENFFRAKSLKFIMANTRIELVRAALNRVFVSTDTSIQNNAEKKT